MAIEAVSALKGANAAGGETALHEILDALRSAVPADPHAETCALCLLTARSVERQTRAFLSEYVNDAPSRETWRQARGFCPRHTPLLATIGDSLAIAILYADLARLTGERWQASGAKPRWRISTRAAGDGPTAPCPACRAETEATRRYVGVLAENLESSEVIAALEGGSSLCVPHVEQVMQTAKPEAANWLREQETARLEALQTELEAIIRKNDYRFRGEEWGAEKDAWLRALRRLKR